MRPTVTQRATRIAVSITRATTQRVPICCLFMYVLGWKVAGSAMLDRLTPRRVLTHVKGPVVIEVRPMPNRLTLGRATIHVSRPQIDRPVMPVGERSKAL